MAGSYFPSGAWITQIIVNGVTLACDTFHHHSGCNLIDVTAFTSGGMSEFIDGPTSGDCTVGGKWNKAFNPNGAGITAGRQATILVRLNNGHAASDDDAWVSDFDVEGDISGPQRFSIRFQFNYSYTDFAGNIVRPI